MGETSYNEHNIVYHVAVCAEVQEGGQRRVSIGSQLGPNISQPPCAGVHNGCCMQWRGLIDEVRTVVCSRLQY